MKINNCIIPTICAASLCLALAACGGGTTETQTETQPTTTAVTTSEAAEPTEEETTSETTEEAAALAFEIIRNVQVACSSHVSSSKNKPL